MMPINFSTTSKLLEVLVWSGHPLYWGGKKGHLLSDGCWLPISISYFLSCVWCNSETGKEKDSLLQPPEAESLCFPPLDQWQPSALSARPISVHLSVSPSLPVDPYLSVYTVNWNTYSKTKLLDHHNASESCSQSQDVRDLLWWLVTLLLPVPPVPELWPAAASQENHGPLPGQAGQALQVRGGLTTESEGLGALLGI